MGELIRFSLESFLSFHLWTATMKAVLALLLICLIKLSLGEEREDIANDASSVGDLLLPRGTRETARRCKQGKKDCRRKLRKGKKKANRRKSIKGKKTKNGTNVKKPTTKKGNKAAKKGDNVEMKKSTNKSNRKRKQRKQ